MDIANKKIDSELPSPKFFEARRIGHNFGVRAGIRDINLGSRVFNVKPGDNIQLALDAANQAGGGVVFLRNGTHKPQTNLTMYSNTAIEGENAKATIIDFASTANQILITGSNAYLTGTVSVSSNGTAVTGVGTVWTAGMIGQSILLDGLWYPISNVASATSLTIALPYAGIALAGVAYRIATPIVGVDLRQLTIKSSNLAAIKVQYIDLLLTYNLTIQSNAKAITVDDASNVEIKNFRLVANNDGIVFTNVSFFDLFAAGCVDQLVTNGITLNTCSYGMIQGLFILNSATDGINITSSKDISIISSAVITNVSKGIHLVSGNNRIFINNVALENNGSDGIKLAASSSECTIVNNILKNNTGYGVNIAAVSCSNNIIGLNNASGNVAGQSQDLGTTTKIRSNIGIADSP